MKGNENKSRTELKQRFLQFLKAFSELFGRREDRSLNLGPLSELGSVQQVSSEDGIFEAVEQSITDRRVYCDNG